MDKYKLRRYIFFLLIAIVVIGTFLIIDQNQKQPVKQIDGAGLFKSNCASCHKADKDFTGPLLKGSLQRWGGDKKEMYAFIRNPAESVNKNAYAKRLFAKWGKVQMTSFRLSDTELDAMMDYWER
ncbi:MAG TPA: cytochrome c [Ferruginibacter sp.]|nr:cytochrome c [Ferruginibacter sp.]